MPVKLQSGADDTLLMVTNVAQREAVSSAPRHREQTVLEQRREVMRQLQNCRYLHRLARAQFDLAAARATTAYDFSLLPQLLTDPHAPDLELFNQVMGSAASIDSPNLGKTRELLQQFASYEQTLLCELDRLTSEVVTELQACPTDCLT